METNKRIKCLVLIMLGLIAMTKQSVAQRKEPIYYYLPSFVLEKVSEYIKSEKNDKDVEYYIFIQSQNDTTHVLVSKSNKSFKKMRFLLSNTNRFVKVDRKITLPLLTLQDLLFSDVLHHVKNNTKGEYEIIEQTYVNPSGYSIGFKGMYHDSVLISTELVHY